MTKSIFLDNSTVTIFSNSPLEKTVGMDKAVETAKAGACGIDERRVSRLIPNGRGEIGVTIRFEDGDSVTVGFLYHRPPTQLVGRDLVDSLGVEVVETEYGTVIKKTEPFQETNIKGVFTAGDARAKLKQVTLAMS